MQMVQFKIGQWLFPILEPAFRFIENGSPDVKKHFNQVKLGIEQKKPAIALLNLNMILSLNPDHFMARVYRGRIYIQEGRFNLASKDYLEANRISRYRFTHHDLYGEYFKSVNKEFKYLGASIVHNFSRAFEALKLAQERLDKDGNAERFAADSGEELPLLDADPIADADHDIKNFQELQDMEQDKFAEFGPITDKEIAKTDWDQLIKKLSS